jgi:hypothetical protein
MTTFCYKCRKLLVSDTGEWKYSAISNKVGQVFFCSKECADFMGIETDKRSKVIHKLHTWNSWIRMLLKE